ALRRGLQKAELAEIKEKRMSAHTQQALEELPAYGRLAAPRHSGNPQHWKRLPGRKLIGRQKRPARLACGGRAERGGGASCFHCADPTFHHRSACLGSCEGAGRSPWPRAHGHRDRAVPSATS